MEFWSENCSKEIKNISDHVEVFRTNIQGKIEQIQFSIKRRVKIDDVKQNFDKLNEMLFIKFK